MMPTLAAANAMRSIVFMISPLSGFGPALCPAGGVALSVGVGEKMDLCSTEDNQGFWQSFLRSVVKSAAPLGRHGLSNCFPIRVGPVLTRDDGTRASTPVFCLVGLR